MMIAKLPLFLQNQMTKMTISKHQPTNLLLKP